MLNLNIDKGDIILTGKFKNKSVEVKEFGVDAKGQPTINGRPILNFRIKKLIPENKMIKLTDILNESLGELPSSKLIKMKWNPITDGPIEEAPKFKDASGVDNVDDMINRLGALALANNSKKIVIRDIKKAIKSLHAVRSSLQVGR